MGNRANRRLVYGLVTIVVVAAVVTLVLRGLRESESLPPETGTPVLEPFAIGLNIWPGYGAFFIADERGFFRAEGLEVNLEIIQGDPERQAALVSNRIQGIGMTLDTLAILRSQGVPVRAIYKYDGSNGADGIVARTEIQKVADLRGKSVGFALGTPSHYLLAEALDKVGLRTSDLDAQNLSSDDAGAAFFAGKLDAAVTWEPWLSQAKTFPDGHLLLTTRNLPVVEDVLFVREDYLMQHPGSVQALLRACFRAVEYWKANPAEGVAIIADRLGMAEGDVEAMLEGISIMALADNKAYFGTEGEPGPVFAAYERVVELWLRDGVISEPDSAENAIDPGPVASLE